MYHTGIYLDDSAVWGKSLRIYVIRFHNRNQQKKCSGKVLALLLSCVAVVGMAVSGVAMAGGSMKNQSSVSVGADETALKIAITFDDGPNEDYTEMLLDGLKERGVHATFFLLGKEVVKYPDIVQAIYEDGHLIGTHSYEHVNLKNLSDSAAVEQVDKTNAVIHDIIGEYPEYIRPPFGAWKQNLDYETKMIEVLWDVDPLDWKTSNSDVIAKRVTTKVQENDIILLHDASESSVKAAFKIIDALQKEGYMFVTVDQILFD